MTMKRSLFLSLAFLVLVPTLAFSQQVFTTTLLGANEPDGGDPDGIGAATVVISGTTVNFMVTANNLSTITGAHIHRLSTRSIVVAFPNNFVNGVLVGSISGADTALLNEIISNPGAFYVNVHSSEKPGGAILGNLAGGALTTSGSPGTAGQESAFTCTEPNDTVLCLNGGRFKTEVTWKTSSGTTGVGHGIKLTNDSGYFWFFNNQNVEMIVKALDACSIGSTLWVFASGLTNVQVTLKVTDSRTGKSKTYSNPNGLAFLPIQDTSAFACP